MFSHVRRFNVVPWRTRIGKIFLGITVVFVVFVAALQLWPAARIDAEYNFKIQGDYPNARKRALEITAIDRTPSADDLESKVNLVCASKILDHGKKQAKAIVMYHGFTNCPAQFDQLAQKFFDQGYNVYIPRIPYHGFEDRLTTSFENLQALELVRIIKESVDIASGLGEEVTLFGISGGAVMAAWGGYFLPEVDTVFMTAPMFAPGDFRNWQLKPLHNLIRILPSSFHWWDEDKKEHIEGPRYAYPRYSLKAANAFIRLSLDLETALSEKKMSQQGKKIILLTLENDPAVNNQVTNYLITLWLEHGGLEFQSYQFPSGENLVHDFIDPNQTKARIDLTYPRILLMIQN